MFGVTVVPKWTKKDLKQSQLWAKSGQSGHFGQSWLCFKFKAVCLENLTFEIFELKNLKSELFTHLR